MSAKKSTAKASPVVAAYNEQQVRVEERRKELVDRYLGKPFSRRHTDLDTEDELDAIETWMLDNPPLCRLDSGVFRKRRKGLVETCKFDAEILPMTMPASEAIEIIPVREWSDLIDDEDAISMRRHAMILDQNGVGSCAAEGITQGIQIIRGAGGQPDVKLNPWFAYNTTSGGVDRGSSLQANVAFAQQYGIASQEVWPRSEGWRRKPSDAAMADGRRYRLLEVVTVRSWEEFGTLLLLGIPVYFGYPGHAILAVRLLSTTKLLYANSWSTDWGDGGFGTLSNRSIAWNYRAYGVLAVVEYRPDGSRRLPVHASAA